MGTFDTSLHQAVRFGDIEEVKSALQEGHDPNLIGLYQWSPLHEAAHNGEKEILKLLLEKQGDPNKPDLLKGNSAVHYAAREGHEQCLQLLVTAGGHYSVYNQDRQNCLDIADPVCHSILQEQQAKDLMCLTKEEARKVVAGESVTDIYPVLDTHPSLSESDTDSIISREDNSLALGYIHLSFEYNSRTGTVRIRVWQISDLLLPPPQTSMISTIYVKGYLMPDKKKDSKRKTEEVKVESSEAHYLNKKMKDKGFQHVFSPCSFKFSKPLEYTNINKSTIEDKSVQLEVCITQKYSKRSFLIGMFYIPMKVAVKKLVKEKYPLIPCMNHTIPTNMKVYSASELKITSSAKIFYSNPNIRSVSMSTLSDPSERAASEIDLKDNHLQEETTRVSMLLSEEDDCCVELGTERDSMTVLPGTMQTGDDHVLEVQAQVHSYENIEKETILDGKDNIYEIHKTVSDTVPILKKIKKKILSSKDQTRIDLGEHETMPPAVESWKYNDIKLSSKQKSPEVHVAIDSHSKSASRSNTPTWDYYDIENPFTEDSITDSTLNTSICIPMETKMGLHQKGKSSFYNTTRKIEDKKISDTLKHHPGKAVPNIIVTAPVGEVKVDIAEPSSKSILSSRDSELFGVKTTLMTPVPQRRRKKKMNSKQKPNRTVDSIEMSSLASHSVSDRVENICPNLLPSTLHNLPHSHEGLEICVIDLTDEEESTKTDEISPSVVVNIEGKQISHRNEFTVPMQVFIEDMTSSDSCDDVVEDFDKMNPFLIQGT